MSEIWLEEHDRGWSLPLAITLGSINIFVVLGNIFVLYILITQKSLHTSTNYIVLSLTLADFLLGVIILPFSMLQEYYSEWIFNELWCKIWLALDVLFSTASIYNLLAISFDRYMAVKQPIKYRFISSNRMIKITISTVWIISAFLAFPPLIYEHFFESQISEHLIKPSIINNISSQFIPKVCTPMTSNNFYILFSAMVSFILPTIFMIILNISIFQTVQDSRCPRLLPLPLTSQSSTGTIVSSTQSGSTCLRVHRGGGGGGGIAVVAGNRNKNFKNSSRSSSMRSRNNKNFQYQSSFRGHSNSFRHYYNESGNPKEEMYVTMHRKRSSSISTLTNLPSKIETLNNEKGDAWMTTTEITQKEGNPMFMKTKNFEPLELRSNKYFAQQGIIEKTARSAIWYPAILAAFVAEKKPTKYNQRMIFYPPVNKSRQSLRTELRVARTIGIVVGCFTICWLPFTIIYILQAFQTCPIDQCISGWLFTIAFWLGYANSAVNPLLYAAVSRDFRSAFRKFLVGKGSRFHSRFSSAHRSS